MFLLNDRQIRSHVEDGNRSYLDIDPFDEESLQHTSYYFRLGTHCKLLYEKGQPLRELGPQNSRLLIPAGGVVKIHSLETFLLSNKVMAIFGQISDFTSWGLQLLHSPFIDPTFVGQLELGLVNPTNGEVGIDWKQRIGKVCFFDVSDTYPVFPPAKGKLLARKFEERRLPLRDDDPVHQ
jgi:deoxycytidine triphosphate deaminase